MAFHAAINLFFSTIFIKGSLDDKHILSVPDLLAVNRVEIAFAKIQVVNGIQEVGFPCPIVSGKAVYQGSELQLGFRVIFEVKSLELFQIHRSKLRSEKHTSEL